jgi:GT2 family glycosyltransferase
MRGCGAAPVRPTELSIIVVTYGALEMSLRCLDTVARGARELPCEVLVVDNGPECGLSTAIMDAHPSIWVAPQCANLGFAGAANLAAARARGEYLLFLNPDTLIPEGAIRRLLQFAKRRPRAGIWGGRTVYGDGTPNPTSCRRRPTIWNLFCSALALDTRFPRSAAFSGMNYGGWARNSEREVDVVCGCFLLVHRQVWDRVAGFSPIFFMYGEDEDFCLRARRLGYKPLFTPDAEIIHFGSGTEPSQERKLRQILASRVLLIRGHFSPVLRPVALMFVALRPWLGRWLANQSLRVLWKQVWARRRQWLRGQFA